ncbi:MAG: NifU family protein [Acidimicrobiales bacterium]
MEADEPLPYGAVLERIGELAGSLSEHPDPEVRNQVVELLDWVDAFHRDGLGRLIDMIRAWRGEIFLESVDADEMVGTMLRAYGLGEDEALKASDDELVQLALASVRPLVESHGGAIDVEKVVDGIVSVRLTGTCDGCPSSDATLTYGVEAALRDHWPNFRRLELVEPATAVDPAKADLECLTLPDDVRREATAAAAAAVSAVPAPAEALLQIRGHEQ